LAIESKENVSILSLSMYIYIYMFAIHELDVWAKVRVDRILTICFSNDFIVKICLYKSKERKMKSVCPSLFDKVK